MVKERRIDDNEATPLSDFFNVPQTFVSGSGNATQLHIPPVEERTIGVKLAQSPKFEYHRNSLAEFLF